MALDGINNKIEYASNTTATTKVAVENKPVNSVITEANKANISVEDKKNTSKLDELLEKLCAEFSKLGLKPEELKNSGILYRISGMNQKQIESATDAQLKQVVDCLKAAIKDASTSENGKHLNIYYEDTSISPDEMLEIVRSKDFSRLPKTMSEAAKEAYETLLHTRDGQLCDVIVDKAQLEAVYQAGKEAKDSIIKEYAESTVAIADIKIAVRAQKTAKSMEFMKRAMAECESLSVTQLAKAAVSGMDAIVEYLSQTEYAEGGRAIAESASAFERWCDNRMMQTMQPQKYQSFSVGPLVAYVLARENEIKTVRIIVSGKRSGLSDDSIRERVREMYV